MGREGRARDYEEIHGTAWLGSLQEDCRGVILVKEILVGVGEALGGIC